MIALTYSSPFIARLFRKPSPSGPIATAFDSRVRTPLLPRSFFARPLVLGTPLRGAGQRPSRKMNSIVRSCSQFFLRCFQYSRSIAEYTLGLSRDRGADVSASLQKG